MNELLQALLNAASRDLAIGFGKESHNKYQVTILDCHTQTSRERVLTEAELEKLPLIINELIEEFEVHGAFPESLVTRKAPNHIAEPVNDDDEEAESDEPRNAGKVDYDESSASEIAERQNRIQRELK